MAQKFKSGDKVRLKSGGPIMTVDGYYKSHNAFTGAITENENLLSVRWFLKDELKFGEFIPDTLDLID